MTKPIDITLTVEERDVIDTARDRILSLSALIAATLRDADTDISAGLSDVAQVIHDDMLVIEAMFDAADERRKTGGAQ